MGLIVDGTWKGNFYDQEQMPAMKVAEIFSIENTLFPKGKKSGKPVQFELDKSKRKVVMGQQRMVKQIQIPTQFTKSLNGDTVTIIYFDKKVQKRDGDGNLSTHLTPRKLAIESKVITFLPSKDADKIVYFALHGQCSTSPLARKQDEKSWGLKDVEQEAITYLSDKREQNRMRNKIFTDDIAVLRMRAKGIDMGNVDNMDDDAVRAKLLKRMEDAVSSTGAETFDAFINKFNAPYSGIRGYIQECLDRRYITRETAVGGNIEYLWSKGLSISGKIVTVPKGSKDKDFLVDHFVSMWDTYRQHVLDAIKLGNKENEYEVKEFEVNVTKADKAVKDFSISEVVNEAIKIGVVVYNPATQGVHLFNSKKKMEKEPFLAVDISTWHEQLGTEFGENAELLKKVKQKLNGKRLGMAAKKQQEV